MIPTYNREKLIPATIQSLLIQDYQKFEIFVVDDGGSDNTEAVVRQFTDQRIHYIKKANGERAAARNFGARMTKGDYINFFDSDDTAYPNHLSVAVESIARLNAPEVFHIGYDIKNERGEIEKICDTLPPKLNSVLIDGNHLSCNGVFIRRDVTESFPFNEDRQLSASEDYELWLRLASRFIFYGVNAVTSTVYNHDNRSVVQADAARVTTRMHLLVKYLMQDEKFMSFYRDKIDLFRSYLNVYVALHMAISKSPKKKSLSLLVDAFRLNPRVIFSRRFAAAVKQTVF